ncbi:MAG: hypothetical protein KIT56_05620 [Gammaproteobacteria bacterium]|nr:hypothetical protein [Gammaproteobacteria bacterium]MCW5583350.1 hypothetical protein [Gammaproteobacteria bacterium]
MHRLILSTFGGIAERGDYPSEKKASLILKKLEYWLTIAMTEYCHQKNL